MKFAVLNGRAVVVDGDGVVDVAGASDGRFGPDPADCYERWGELRAWAAGSLAGARHDPLPSPSDFGPPTPRPRQVFGIGVNYADHAAEAGMISPDDPMVFGKFASCIAAPGDPLVVSVPTVDWEVELVVVIAAAARNLAPDDAWSAIAGLTIGQDISDRTLQMAGNNPQFGLAKSRPGYGPIGPWLVTPDEFDDPDDLAISCTVNGEQVQQSRTSHMIHGVPELISYLSGIVDLLPGDAIFTGTPAGVGFTRQPPRYLAPGDVIVSAIQGIGELRTVTVGPPGAAADS